jgi:cob(I)alamin adenosyltransferase
VRIYTKTGDDGSTGLLGAGRVSKDHTRVEVYGGVDEVNAALGLARALGLDAGADALVARLQEELFVLGSALADPDPAGPFHHAITARHVEDLE